MLSTEWPWNVGQFILFWWNTFYHIVGAVNKKNFPYLAVENPHEIHRLPLHSLKLTVWCTLSSSCLIRSYFFEDNDENNECYTGMVNSFFTPRISPIPNQENLWCQKDEDTTHTVHVIMVTVRNLFKGHVIICRSLVHC